MMHWLVISTALLTFAGSALGRTAFVAPASGQVLRGVVRVTERGLLVVNAAEWLRVELPLTNLAWAVFETPGLAVEPGMPEPLPESWREEDIGEVIVKGTTIHQAGRFTLRSAGLGVRGLADSFHFVFRPVQGDTEIIAHIGAVHRTHPAAQAGLMMRENLGASSRQILAGVTTGRAGFFVWRDGESAPAQVQTQDWGGAPCWVKLKREANVFSAYCSRNGYLWTAAGKVGLRMDATYYVGLASASAREGTVNSSTFERLTVGTNLVNELYPPRAELVSGSVVVGHPVSQPNGGVEYHWGFGSMSLPAKSIARLIFQQAPAGWLSRLGSQQTGVLLSNGQFLESDFRQVDGRHLRVSSVLYGAKTMDAYSEVVLVSLQPKTLGNAGFEVTTLNGSVWRAQTLALGEDELILKEPALGTVRVPVHDVAAVFRR
jgi:hypothetical protein